MKIRTGCVSNSSSSSFCILANQYSNIFELAQEMVLCRGWDETSSLDADDVLFNQLEQDKKNLHDVGGLAFSTCNFATYIRKMGQCYVIETSNNCPWYELDWRTVNWYGSSSPLEELRATIVEWSNSQPRQWRWEDDVAEFCEFHLGEIGLFWYPEWRVFGRRPFRRDRICEEHKCSCCDPIQLTTGEIICPICNREKNAEKK
jgi:hypothetical protein